MSSFKPRSLSPNAVCVRALVCMHDVSSCFAASRKWRVYMHTLLYCPSDCIEVKECEAAATVNSMKLETMRPRFNQRRESHAAIDLRSCHNPLIKNIAWFNFTALTDLLIAISVLEVAFARNEL